MNARLNGWPSSWIGIAAYYTVLMGACGGVAWCRGRKLAKTAMPANLRTIVKRMIDAGEPEDNIGAVIRGYTRCEKIKLPPDFELVQPQGEVVIIADDGTEHAFPQ